MCQQCWVEASSGVSEGGAASDMRVRSFAFSTRGADKMMPADGRLVDIAARVIWGQVVFAKWREWGPAGSGRLLCSRVVLGYVALVLAGTNSRRPAIDEP